jgi:hypothetical protein
MTCKKSNKKTITVGKLLSICLMVFCLLFLTSLNFFVYPSGSDAMQSSVFGMNTEESDNDYPPSGPTEEKSCNSSVTIAEEILHEAHPEFDFKASNQLYLHHIAEAQKIEMFHPERVLPPPKF